MCGIVAVYGTNNVVRDIYESLTVLQHRGQDASGILTNHDGKITSVSYTHLTLPTKRIV